MVGAQEVDGGAGQQHTHRAAEADKGEQEQRRVLDTVCGEVSGGSGHKTAESQAVQEASWPFAQMAFCADRSILWPKQEG